MHYGVKIKSVPNLPFTNELSVISNLIKYKAYQKQESFRIELNNYKVYSVQLSCKAMQKIIMDKETIKYFLFVKKNKFHPVS